MFREPRFGHLAKALAAGVALNAPVASVLFLRPAGGGDETARGERILVQVVERCFAALRKCSSLSVLVYRK